VTGDLGDNSQLTGFAATFRVKSLSIEQKRDMKAFLCFLVVACITGGCHKTETAAPVAHRPPDLIGAWQWVGTYWAFQMHSGTTYPGKDSMVILTLAADSNYTITVNGGIGVANTWHLDTTMTASSIDTLLVFNNPGYYSFAAGSQLYGYQALTISSDTMSIFSVTPDGFSQLKFVPYP
jgi:hypothetical protein